MSDNRIVLRLHEQIAFERDFSARYRTVPRARRQEWIRSILRAGLQALEGPVVAAPAQPVATAQHQPAPVPIAPKAARTPSPAPAAGLPKTQAAGDLRGFFGDAPSNGANA